MKFAKIRDSGQWRRQGPLLTDKMWTKFQVLFQPKGCIPYPSGSKLCIVMQWGIRRHSPRSGILPSKKTTKTSKRFSLLGDQDPMHRFCMMQKALPPTLTSVINVQTHTDWIYRPLRWGQRTPLLLDGLVSTCTLDPLRKPPHRRGGSVGYSHWPFPIIPDNTSSPPMGRKLHRQICCDIMLFPMK